MLKPNRLFWACLGLSALIGFALCALISINVHPHPHPDPCPPPKTDHLVEHILHSDDRLLACNEELVWLKAEPKPDCECVPEAGG